MTVHVAIPGTDLSVFPLSLGGSVFGWTLDQGQSESVLDAFVAGGGNFIDTADSYTKYAPGNHGGESESVLGRWLAARSNRDDLVIATKAGGHPRLTGQDRNTVHAALDASLNRLRTDYVDLYYPHYDDASVSIEEQAQTYDELVQSGKVRYLGLANYAPNRMRHWFEYATEVGLAVPVAIQPLYNLVERHDFENGYAPIVEKYRPAVFSSQALAVGFLAGKYRSRYDMAARDREASAESYLTPNGMRVIDELGTLARKRDTEMASIALAWLRAKGVTAPVTSARVTEQLPALMNGVQLELSDDDVARLDRVSRAFA